ncbi:DNA-binding response regulator [Anaerobacillus alkalidiazotrophicus]|uniref:histidine kinase n=1 Tax=Anaerobacillus alkalidiazotrophicus TaxID=472963 RepID=A0A1S2M2D6_9BACI|nr:response regulator transcription factor [Anaerobacillus alkalidiazotrophicus]OIJ18680.1 DNA-binding response regulator [Anaerobacillus alkalidiazotrophicus]
MEKKRVLIVDDEWKMRKLIEIFLISEGFEVREAQDGYEAINIVKQFSIDLIILDLMMPEIDGIEVCKRIREINKIPIIMLTAKRETKDKVEGLNSGADDYLTKPFEKEELLARINALLRRTESQGEYESNKTITFNEITLNWDSRKVLIRDNEVDFTPKEFHLLYSLAKHPSRVFTREQLLYQIWGDEHLSDIRTVDTHVKNIRLKILKAGLSFSPIRTVWGVGYQFEQRAKNEPK